MKNTKNQNIRLGLFITVGLLLLVVAIYLLGRDRQIFGHSVKISAVFKDVKGLKVGNNVQFSGITIGSVSGMKIKNDSAIQVQMSIDKRAVKFLKEDSK
ncbi:MAG TPA: MlaD family protein, partial [Bacteroidales bacterium]|nr:MlaD family protein [Bacteroidales bacterium]